MTQDEYLNWAPITITTSHSFTAQWMNCGRWFKSEAKDKAGMRRYQQRVNRHTRTCTRCKRSKRENKAVDSYCDVLNGQLEQAKMFARMVDVSALDNAAAVDAAYRSIKGDA